MTPNLEKSLHRKGLVEWLKVKALSSNPSAANKQNTQGKPMSSWDPE
jgi:hypothetical protein